MKTEVRLVENLTSRKVFSISSNGSLYIATFADVGRYFVDASKSAITPPMWKLHSLVCYSEDVTIEFTYNKNQNLSMAKLSSNDTLETRIIIYSAVNNAIVDYIEVGSPTTIEHTVYNYDKISHCHMCESEKYTGALSNFNVNDLYNAENRLLYLDDIRNAF